MDYKGLKRDLDLLVSSPNNGGYYTTFKKATLEQKEKACEDWLFIKFKQVRELEKDYQDDLVIEIQKEIDFINEILVGIQRELDLG